MIYEIFSSKALHMNSKICIEISVEVQETAQPVLRIVLQDVLCFYFWFFTHFSGLCNYNDCIDDWSEVHKKKITRFWLAEDKCILM